MADLDDQVYGHTAFFVVVVLSWVLSKCQVCCLLGCDSFRNNNTANERNGFWMIQVRGGVHNLFACRKVSEIITIMKEKQNMHGTLPLLVSGSVWAQLSMNSAYKLVDVATTLLCQACVLGHAIEYSFLCYEIDRSVKLCDLSLVQHQHSERTGEKGFFRTWLKRIQQRKHTFSTCRVCVRSEERDERIWRMTQAPGAKHTQRPLSAASRLELNPQALLLIDAGANDCTPSYGRTSVLFWSMLKLYTTSSDHRVCFSAVPLTDPGFVASVILHVHARLPTILSWILWRHFFKSW